MFKCKEDFYSKMINKWHNMFDDFKEERPYKCPVAKCFLTFSFKNNLKRHLNSFHKKSSLISRKLRKTSALFYITKHSSLLTH
mmetsp:Transcript_18588/g.17671  ORF Transcript_18588/g.17671 Transcript_18588/m.17671 type:complete len:83 (+) Transcript_18588:84-332(+)